MYIYHYSVDEVTFWLGNSFIVYCMHTVCGHVGTRKTPNNVYSCIISLLNSNRCSSQIIKGCLSFGIFKEFKLTVNLANNTVAKELKTNE